MTVYETVLLNSKLFEGVIHTQTSERHLTSNAFQIDVQRKQTTSLPRPTAEIGEGTVKSRGAGRA